MRQFSTVIRTVDMPITPGPRCIPVTSYRSIPSVMYAPGCILGVPLDHATA